MDPTTKAIVVGTDGSARAGRAVARAAELAALSNATLHIVRAYTATVDQAVPHDMDPYVRVRLLAEIEATDRGIHNAEAARLRAGGLLTEVHRERGEPVAALCRVARAVDASMIVVGNRGIDGPLGLIGRSLPHRVSRAAPCDVLVVDTAA